MTQTHILKQLFGQLLIKVKLRLSGVKSRISGLSNYQKIKT
jgi:hypothetical protein